MHHDASGAVTSARAAARPGTSLRARERDARSRYARALLAALESLRRAEQRFDASAAVIDEHIQQALVAAGSLVLRPVAAEEVPA